MSNIILAGGLASALNEQVISEAFEIARSNRTGILQTASMGAPMLAEAGFKMSWTEGQVSAQGSLAADDVAIAGTSLEVSAGDGGNFRAGMTLSVSGSDEVILVTAVAGDVLTIVRGFGATVAKAIATDDKVTIDSVGREENSLAENDTIWQPYLVENYFQTMDTAIEMGRRSLAALQYGDTNDLSFQVAERIKQLAIQMGRTLIRGRKAVATIDGKDISYTGGMRHFINQAGTSTDASGAVLTLELINDMNEEIVTAGGYANTIAVSVKKARMLQKLVSAEYDSATLANWSNDAGALNALPSMIPLLGNVSQIVIDTNLDDSEVIMYDSNRLSIRPMAANNAEVSGAWRTVDATQNGQDGQRVRVIGDFAMEVRDAKSHMQRLSNLA